MSFFQLFPAILSAAARSARSRAKAFGLGGNNHGDGWQNGGCLVVEKGGGEKPLLFYVQETAPAIVSNRSIFQVNIRSLKTHGNFILIDNGFSLPPK